MAIATATDRRATVGFILSDFRDAFNAVARAVPGRTPKPVLQSVRLDLAQGEAVLCATNLEMWLQRKLSVEYSATIPFAVLLPRATVGEILRVADDDTITLEVRGDRLALKTTTSSWNLTTSDPDEFPTAPEVQADSTLEVASDRLLLAIRRVIRDARPGEEKGYRKDVVQVEPLMLGLTLTSTNGRSMAHQKVEATAHGTPYALSPLPLVPDVALRTLAAVLERSESPVQILFPSSSWVRFETADTFLIASLAHGQFTNWRPYVARLPRPAGTITVPAGSLRRTIARAAVSLDETTRSTVISFDERGLTAQAESSRGESEARLDVEWKGADVEIRIDPQYMLPMLSSLGEENSVDLSVWNAEMPLRITTEDGFLGLINSIEAPKK